MGENCNFAEMVTKGQRVNKRQGGFFSGGLVWPALPKLEMSAIFIIATLVFESINGKAEQDISGCGAPLYQEQKKLIAFMVTTVISKSRNGKWITKHG